jgi:hypothetical protein
MRVIPRTLSVALVWGCLLSWMIVPNSASSGEGMEEYVRVAARVKMMQGHLIASLENHKLGQTPLAQAHAAHPLHEDYGELPDTFAKAHPDLDKMVRDTLARLPQALGKETETSAYAKQVEAAIQLLDQVAIVLIPPDARKLPAFQAAVLTDLLEEIEEEYDEAVKDGKIVNLAEYQDAFGFLRRAHVVKEQLSGQVKGGDQQQMQTLWNALEEAIPGIMPPASPKSSQVVQGHVNALVAILQRI